MKSDAISVGGRVRNISNMDLAAYNQRGDLYPLFSSSLVCLVPDWSPRPLWLSIPKPAFQHISGFNLKELQKEKLYVLIHCLLQRKRRMKLDDLKAEEDGICLSVTVLRGLFAERNSETLNALLHWGVLRIVKEYSSGHHSRGYWFGEGFYSSPKRRVKVSNARLCKKLIEWQRDKVKRILTGKVLLFQRLPLETLQRELVDLSRVQVERDESLAEILANHSMRGTRRIVSELERGKLRYFSLKENGRLAHSLCSLPSKIRERSLRLDGEPIVEWDIPASHPAFIVSLASELGLDGQERIDLIRLLQSRLFYRAYESLWRPEDAEEGIKVLFQKVFYDARLERMELPLWRTLKKELPSFVEKLKELKRRHRGRGTFANFIQGEEAALILKVLARFQDRGMACFSVYDSILVPYPRAIEARDIFNEELSRRLGFNLFVKTNSHLMKRSLGDAPLPFEQYPVAWKDLSA